MSIEAMKLALEALAYKNSNLQGELHYEAITALRTAIEQAEKQEPKTPIKILELTVRTEHILRRGRVCDVETLRAMDVRDILAIPDCGKKTLKEISEALQKYDMITERKLMKKQREVEQAEKQEIEPDKDWVENDGCPTEKSVLQRFWREHQQAKKQEPVAWCIIENGRVHGLVKTKPAVMNAEKWQPLYAAPPQREWVGLTDEEYEAMAEKHVTNCYFDTLTYGKEIEAKLKDKNT